jgi:adenylate kinase family enzyme
VARRISVAGASGSGKTTTSLAIAERLGLPHVELDALFHGPDWTTPPQEEFQRRVMETLDALGSWVADGTTPASLDRSCSGAPSCSSGSTCR